MEVSGIQSEEIVRSLEQQEEQQRMLPCSFFVKGFCAQGNRCRFYHPAPPNLSKAIHVPPFPSDFGPTPLMNVSPMGFVPSSSPLYGFVPTTQRRNNFFGHEPDLAIDSSEEDYLAFRRNFIGAEFGEEGDVSTVILPNGVTSTIRNGMVCYEYPESVLRSALNRTRGQQHGREEGDGHTMFPHINWNEFMLPGKSPPAYVSVPLEPDDKPESDKFGKEDEDYENRDMPPEGSVGSRKMSAKEEFQLKVKQLAQNPYDAPVSQVRSLDSFFNNNEGIENLPPEMLTRKEASTENSGGENLNGSKPLNILLDLLQSEATRESKEESENEKERSNNSEEENGNTTVE